MQSADCIGLLIQSADWIRGYAKYVLKEGADIEKRELLGCLKSKICLANKKITLKNI